DSLVIDSKSGVSGAGRKLKDPYLFISLNENFYAYSALGHRHIGEMEQEIEKIYKKKVAVSFTPHILPLNRGIFSSIYIKAEGMDEGKLKSLYDKYYSNSCFVRYMEDIPQIGDVAGTNNCLISARYDRRAGVLKVFTAIDNLLKGAAGQAVQNMNLALGLPEDEGLKLQGINT
ncbi:MAG: Asd/ArgC dimerization domain-containing protein, partial [Actinomycetota bacterium]